VCSYVRARELQIRETINKNGFSAAILPFYLEKNPDGMFHHVNIKNHGVSLRSRAMFGKSEKRKTESFEVELISG